jgi:hypothetical protein
LIGTPLEFLGIFLNIHQMMFANWLLMLNLGTLVQATVVLAFLLSLHSPRARGVEEPAEIRPVAQRKEVELLKDLSRQVLRREDPDPRMLLTHAQNVDVFRDFLCVSQPCVHLSAGAKTTRPFARNVAFPTFAAALSYLYAKSHHSSAEERFGCFAPDS